MVKGGFEVLHLCEKLLFEAEDGGDMHRCCKAVVRRAGEVDVVVGVDGGFGAEGGAEELVRAV